MKKKVSKKNRKEVSSGVATTIIILTIVIITCFMFKNNILRMIDYNIRNQKITEAYNNRKIVQGSNEFTYVNNLGVKLNEAKIEEGKLNISLALDIPEEYLNKKLCTYFGILVVDENNNLYDFADNPYMYEVISENKQVIDTSFKYCELIYTKDIKKRLGKENEYQIKLKICQENIEIVDGVPTIKYSTKVPIRLYDASPDKLYININEIMIFSYENLNEINNKEPDIYNKFTEWKFEVNL